MQNYKTVFNCSQLEQMLSSQTVVDFLNFEAMQEQNDHLCLSRMMTTLKCIFCGSFAWKKK